jgi:hypothetical protein
LLMIDFAKPLVTFGPTLIQFGTSWQDFTKALGAFNQPCIH